MRNKLLLISHARHYIVFPSRQLKPLERKRFNQILNRKHSPPSLNLCSSSLLSARLKAFKMSLDQVEVVSKLLRASRNCNELLLKDCFKDILENGITGKELNSTDKSGRVSHAYTIKRLSQNRDYIYIITVVKSLSPNDSHLCCLLLSAAFNM